MAAHIHCGADYSISVWGRKGLSKGLEWAVVLNSVYFVSRLRESWKLDNRNRTRTGASRITLCVSRYLILSSWFAFWSLLHTLAYSYNSRFRYDFALVARPQYFSTLVLTARPVKFSCVLSCDVTRVGPCQLWPFTENAAVLQLCSFFPPFYPADEYISLDVSRLCCHFCWCRNYSNTGNCCW